MGSNGRTSGAFHYTMRAFEVGFRRISYLTKGSGKEQKGGVPVENEDGVRMELRRTAPRHRSGIGYRLWPLLVLPGVNPPLFSFKAQSSYIGTESAFAMPSLHFLPLVSSLIISVPSSPIHPP